MEAQRSLLRSPPPWRKILETMRQVPHFKNGGLTLNKLLLQMAPEQNMEIIAQQVRILPVFCSPIRMAETCGKL